MCRIFLSLVLLLGSANAEEHHDETSQQQEPKAQATQGPPTTKPNARFEAPTPPPPEPKFASYLAHWNSKETKSAKPDSLEAGIWTGTCAHREFERPTSEIRWSYLPEDPEKVREALFYVIKKDGDTFVMPFSVEPPIATWVKSSVETGKPAAEVMESRFDYKGIYESLKRIAANQGTPDNGQAEWWREKIPRVRQHGKGPVAFPFPRFDEQPKSVPPLGFDMEQKRFGGINVAFIKEMEKTGKKELLLGFRLPNTASTSDFPTGAGSFCHLDNFIEAKRIKGD